MASNTYAAMTADVVASRRTSGLRSLLTEKLRAISKVHMADEIIKVPYAVAAGDEFQTVVSRLDEIPAIIFDLRRRFRPLALRIGVGIGKISEPIRQPANRLGGEAFEFARQALERIKQGDKRKFEVLTAFQSTEDRFDMVANALYGLHDTLVQNVSEKQWKTINVYLESRHVKIAAKKLRVNESTVSRNLRRGYLWQMEETTQVMKEIIRGHFR